MAKPRITEEEAAVDELMGEFELDPIEKRYMGPLLKYMTKDKIANASEVIMNKPGQVVYERFDGSWEFVDAPELTKEQLYDAARVIANRFGQVFGPGRPIMSCKMPQGHRLQVVAGDCCPAGFALAIRLQNKRTFTIDDYKISDDDKKRIIETIKGQRTILISGGTSTGKTSFMNAVLKYIPEHERLVTIEDVPELEVPHKNWLQLLFGMSTNEEYNQKMIRDLLNATLRLRPDRIIMGEIRKENAFTFCSAINTGHEGSMSTIHSNSPSVALDAVVNRAMMSGEIPESTMQVLRRQLKADIYGVVQLDRVGRTVEGYFTELSATDEV